MATRSTISIKENGKIRTIYCHWDGYPSNNGAILLEHYTTTDKVNELINLGGLSSLRENVAPNENGGTLRSWSSEKKDYDTIPTKEPHSFDKPYYDVVVAYHRDRGEDLEISEYKYQKDIQGEEYDYLFKDGKWIYRDYSGKWKPLTQKVCED